MGIRVKENSPRGGKRGRILRAFALAFGAGAVALALSACVTGPTTPPSAAVPPPDALARFDPSAEGVEIAPLEGTPAPMAKLLQRSVVDAFGRYNVPASPSPGGGRYLLSGHAGPNRDPAPSSVVAIEWQIFDRRLGRETGRFTLPVAGDRFAWDNGDPRVITQVGGGTSRQFVALIDGARPVAVSHGPRDMPAAPFPAAALAPPGAQAPTNTDPAAISAPAYCTLETLTPAPARSLARSAGERGPLRSSVLRLPDASAPLRARPLAVTVLSTPTLASAKLAGWVPSQVTSSPPIAPTTAHV